MPSATGEPAAHLGFPLTEELRGRTEAILAKLRSAERPRDHAGELVDLVVELTHVGLDHFYLKPLEIARVGMVARGSARVAVAAADRSIPMMVRRIVGSMSDQQLLAVAGFMDGLLIRR